MYHIIRAKATKTPSTTGTNKSQPQNIMYRVLPEPTVFKKKKKEPVSRSNGKPPKFVCPLKQDDPHYVVYKDMMYTYSHILKESFPLLPKNQIRKIVFRMFCDLPPNLYAAYWNEYMSKFSGNEPDSDASCYSSEYESESENESESELENESESESESESEYSDSDESQND